MPSESWSTYLQTLQEVQQQAVRQYSQLVTEYASTVHNANKDVADRAAEAYRTYLQDLQSGWDVPDARQAAADAYQAYVEAVQKYKAEGEQATADAFNQMTRAATSTSADAQEKARTASAYNETVRDLWLDPGRSQGVTEAYEKYTASVQQWVEGMQNRLNEATQKYTRAKAEGTMQSDAPSNAKAAYDKYVEGVYGLYRDAIGRISASANDALLSLQRTGGQG